MKYLPLFFISLNVLAQTPETIKGQEMEDKRLVIVTKTNDFCNTQADPDKCKTNAKNLIDNKIASGLSEIVDAQ